ncbi:MAG: OsmC family protein [Gemmatimonadaceae bacterium]
MKTVDYPIREGVQVGRVNHVTIAWTGEHRFEAGRAGHAQVTFDSGGTTGPGPVDALLIALGTCTAIDVLDILAKRRTPAESLTMEVHGARADAVPARLVGAELVYRISGAGIERTHAERAVALAVEKYCSVRSSLDPEIPICWRVELNSSVAK